MTCSFPYKCVRKKLLGNLVVLNWVIIMLKQSLLKTDVLHCKTIVFYSTKIKILQREIGLPFKI